MSAGNLDQGEPKCISFGGTTVDEAIAREVLRVVRPAAMEAALLAAQQKVDKQDELLRARISTCSEARVRSVEVSPASSDIRTAYMARDGSRANPATATISVTTEFVVGTLCSRPLVTSSHPAYAIFSRHR